MSIKKRILIASVLVVLVAALAGGAIYVWFFRNGKSGGGSSDGLTEKELQQLDEVNEKLSDVRDSKKYADMDPNEQMEVMLDAINELADDKLIKADSILVNKDEMYISYEYTSGVLGAETFGRNNELAGAPGNTYIDNGFYDLKDDIILSPHGRGSVLILDAFMDQSDLGQYAVADQCKKMAEKWREKSVDTKIDYTVTLDELMYLDDYDFVLFMMHGCYTDYKTKDKTQMLWLTQKENSETNRVYNSDLKNNYIIPVDGVYTVTPAFFEEYYSSKETKLDDSIFFFDCCNQMGSGDEYSNRWNDVCDKIGVSAFVAFHDSPSMKYGIDIAEVFMDHLLCDETAYEAYKMSVLAIGGNNNEWLQRMHYEANGANPAVPYFGGDYNAKFKWLREATPTPSSTPAPIEADAKTTLIGSEITLGNYRGEDIKWIVLDANDKNMLVISKDIIEAKSFNDSDADVTWETCTLRKWLNEDFYQTAFSSSEREQIQKTLVVTPDDPTSGADGGEDTEDNIFILSVDEANKYFASDDDRRAAPKDYLSEQELGIYDGYGYWWLRSPSSDTVGKYATKNGACVGSDGNVNNWGEWITTPEGIRPVMWIDKNVEPAEGAGSDPTNADKATLVRDGDVVIFGKYEQDGNTGNGKEPIEWEIVTEQDGKMLLISKYILDCQPYNTEDTEVTWETCSLRQWLNNDFYNTAFNESERKLIETTTLSNPDNPFGGKGGNNTDDKVFCLSVEEVYRYLDILYETDSSYGGNFCFSLDFLREVTPYARDRGVVHLVMPEGYFDFTQVPIDESDLIGKDFGNWWLRSPAKSNDWACVVFLSGQAGYQDVIAPVGTGSEGVRPAIWVCSGNYADINVTATELTSPLPDHVKATYLDIVDSISYEDFKSDAYGVPTSGTFTFDLVYIDNDEIPELLVCLSVDNGPNGAEVFANLYSYTEYEYESFQVIQRWSAERTDAHTEYYPRENLIKEVVRTNTYSYRTTIANVVTSQERARTTTFESEYEGAGDSMTVKHYIFESTGHLRASELTEKEFTGLTTGKGEAKPLIATMSKAEITEMLK